MKRTNSGSNRQKIILYYTLAVVLPGFLLGFLAYRGIQNDQALREKESRKKLEINSQAFFTEIDSSFVQFMYEQTSDTNLSQFKKGDPSMLVLFVKDSSGSKKLISHQMLYLPAEFLTIKNKQLSPPANIEEGLRLEFVGRRFSEALRFYQNKSRITKNSAEKIQAMIASARLYNKLNQTDKAIAMYNKIGKDYRGSLLNGQIPVGLIAGLEILKINQAIGENNRNNSLQYLEFLLHPPCEYDKNQFEMFYQSFKDIIRETDPVIDSMFAKLDTQKTITDHLIRILSGSNLIEYNGYDHFRDDKIGVSSIPINSSELVIMYLSRVKNNGEQTGILIDFPAFLKSISDKLIQKLDPNSSINFIIEDNNGMLIFSKIINEETGYLSFPFPEKLPQWKLLLSENKPGFLASLLKAGSGIYLYIFILIALLMALGFVFTIYTLNGELRLNKLKSEFISNVSHELKSPLTSIRMMTEMLHHKRVSTEERKSEYYSAMLEDCEHLSHLIDNILDFSRMDEDRKKYDFIDLDLDELLLRFLESTRERLPEPGFDIRYSCPDRVPIIRADKDAILQVFYNLIDNAIKFSGTSRQIDIDLFTKNDELLLCVKDYGIGISGQDQEKIFDRFYRGYDPQKMGIKGSGIGLTIVKKIMEAHKGQLTLESIPGKGSTFTVRIPLKGT
ncbi:MAG: HAMP domain-containing sensor histidine kinase [Desulfobacula sp.]|jgi:signal transduction histidine kinase|nr:HAMP domain-containing sensor histidine kinase [Desulfobacula sp.]